MKKGTLAQFETLISRYPKLAENDSSIREAVRLICEAHYAGSKILLFGNGGSAADADHIAGELAKAFCHPRSIPREHVQALCEGCEDGAEIAKLLQCGVAAISLAGSSALTTAIGNDTHADLIFAQQVYAIGRPGDVVVGISTSGNSRNVVQALKVAHTFGMKTIGLTGGNPAAMDSWCDALIKVPATETYHIQEYHLPVYHTLCLAVEAELFGD